MVGSWKQNEIYVFIKNDGPVCRKDIQKRFKLTAAGASRMFNIMKKMSEAKTSYKREKSVTGKLYLVEYIRIV